jgi:uncharacterized SAM-binding protein YcdF (DUF218 family)
VRRVVLVAVAAWALAASLLFVRHHDDRPVRADAVVVLAGSKTRLPVGLRLMKEGDGRVLLVSQGSRTRLERRVCAGLTPYRVTCFTPEPNSTRGEARYVAGLARRRGWRRIDVVTSQFHVFRAHVIFRRCWDGELHMIGAPQPEWKLPWYAVTESAKLVYQLLFARGC